MIHEINLKDNSERVVDLNSLKASDLLNVWFELADPTDQELEAVAAKIGLSKVLLELPKTDNLINLRLEDDLVVINFVIPQDTGITKNFLPIVIVFSKNFLVTVIKRSD